MITIRKPTLQDESAFFGELGIIIYIVLWILMLEAMSSQNK